ncbi:FecCD family ABC transporter permease [Bacillus xiapuensis]|uniref:FecCD family ABC transporter permease n=1 Tax=Bacillus xiapuensis TaxID=2014075 RepID=UPI0018E1DBB1|nr:iron ABC transporter permease [Bacillus xiapuensis]
MSAPSAAKLQRNQLIADRKKKWFPFLVSILVILLMVSVTAAVTKGPVAMSAVRAWKIILFQVPWIGQWVEPDWTQAQAHIIWNIRLPRVLLGAVVGAGLSAAGVVIQALVRNPLADPYILGVSSGASVAAALVLLFGAFSFLGPYSLSIGAFFGAACSMVLVYMLAKIGGKILTSRLLLAGIAVSLTMSAATNFIVTMAPRDAEIREAMFWMMGSLAGAKWEYVGAPATFILLCSLFLLLYSETLNALLMGEEAANTLGVNTELFRKVLIIILSLMTGAVVAVSGSIGFIGLMIPHIARFLTGSDHKRVLPVSLLLGMLMVIWSDTIARTLFAPQELPIGVVTALCGGPFFIWLLRRSSYAFGGVRS